MVPPSSHATEPLPKGTGILQHKFDLVAASDRCDPCKGNRTGGSPNVAAIAVIGEFTLRQANDPAIAVSGKFQVPKTPTNAAPIPASYQSPALCFKRDICVVTGKFSGDSRNTFVAFDNVPELSSPKATLRPTFRCPGSWT